MHTKWIFAFPAALALAGCSTITTMDSISGSVEGTTQSISSVTSSVGGGEDGSHYEAKRFVDSQFDMVRRDAAAGGGEYTATLARLMGEADAEAFGAWMQRNYAELFENLDEREVLVERIRVRRET